MPAWQNFRAPVGGVSGPGGENCAPIGGERSMAAVLRLPTIYVGSSPPPLPLPSPPSPPPPHTHKYIYM